MRVHMQVGGGKNQLIIKLQLHAEREYIARKKLVQLRNMYVSDVKN